METILISISKADLSRLIVDAVSATLKVQAPSLAPMNVEEAANFLHLTPSTLYKKTSEGTIPHRKLGKKLLFDRGELAAWVAQHSIKTSQQIEGEVATRVAIG